MDADDENDFLAPDFDPQAVTIPRLRSILLQQNVNYPATAKKGQLVDLFHQKVAPNLKKLRKAHQRTQPTTRGIEDLFVNGDEDAEPGSVAQSVEATPRRSSRNSVPRKTDPSVTPSRRSSAAVSSRAATEDRSRASVSLDARESSERQSRAHRRRTRHSAVAPIIKEEDESTSEVPYTRNDDSPFSSDNPFQNGSSPTLPPTKGERRRTVGITKEEFAARPRKAPRKTDTATEIQARRRVLRKSPTPAPTETSDSNELEDYLDDDEELTETGEEFTQEEQDELEEEQALTGKQDLLPARRKPGQERGGSALRNAVLAILVAGLGGAGVVWRQEKLNVGFCGVGRPSTSIGGVEIPDWARFLQPDCEPCPPHAFCHAQLETTCEPDFVLQQHPLSLGGAIPLSPTCEPDGEKARKVKAFATRAIGELRERNAMYECGLKDEVGRRIQSPKLAEQDLKSKVSTMRRRDMSQAEFDDLWSGALGELMGQDEIVSGSDGLLKDRTIRSNSLARIPFACALRRSVRLTVARYIWQLIGVVTLCASILYTKNSIVSKRDNEQKAKRLASFALDRLATRAAQHAQSPMRFPDAYISMSQLRDDVLRNEFSSATRQRLWSKVQSKVESNSNVRSMVREARTGEVSRVWEWIGTVAAIEETPAAPRSSPPAEPPSSPVRRLEGPIKRESEERKDYRRWEEGRPIY